MGGNHGYLYSAVALQAALVDPQHFSEFLKASEEWDESCDGSFGEMLVKKVEIIPIEVIIRNQAAGSICRRLGIAEGSKLDCSVLEYCLKDDALSDPLVNEYHIRAFKLATDEEIATIRNKWGIKFKFTPNLAIWINRECIKILR